MARTKPVRCLAAVALATTLLSIPSLAAADPEPMAAGPATRQAGLWARLLAWLQEPPGVLTSVIWYSPDIDPDGQAASTSPGTPTSDYSADIDPNG